jgi:NADPH:quinone reductase-like Zn-dependent oxidoreductase
MIHACGTVPGHESGRAIPILAASVNRADLDGIQPRPQFMRLFMGLRAPRQPQIGVDVAGVVDSVGAGVTRTGVCSRVKVDFVRSLGADVVLSYQEVNFTRLARQWDWILGRAETG